MPATNGGADAAIISLAHKLTRRLRRFANGDLPFLWPDGKAQVTIAYEDEKPCCPAVVISSQHNEGFA